jgi:hypothetical protein
VDSIGSRFGVIFPLINTHTLRMLVMWRSAFDGDLEKLMIVAAVVDQGIKASGFAEQSFYFYIGSFIFDAVAPPKTFNRLLTSPEFRAKLCGVKLMILAQKVGSSATKMASSAFRSKAHWICRRNCESSHANWKS